MRMESGIGTWFSEKKEQDSTRVIAAKIANILDTETQVIKSHVRE
jgi:hypothetical protein